MNEPSGYINKIHDGEGKPFRYRQRVYPTLVWLARHPDRRRHDGLVDWIWFEMGISMIYLLLSGAATFHGVASYRLAGSVSPMSYVFALVAVVVMLGRYRSARSLMHYAATIDLKTNICPACGYPLSAEEKNDDSTNAICTECGRRWTSPPQWDRPQRLKARDRAESTTDASD